VNFNSRQPEPKGKVNAMYNGIDPLSNELHEAIDPGVQHLLSALDGDVQAQGIKLSHRDWLDMGSDGWQNTSDEAKSAAFQSATMIGGWDESALKALMLQQYPHLQSSVIDLTISTLHEMTEQHPLHIADVNVRSADVVIQRHQDISVTETKSSQTKS